MEDYDNQPSSRAKRPSPWGLALPLGDQGRGAGSTTGSISSRRLSASSQMSYASSRRSARKTESRHRSRKSKGGDIPEPEVIQVFDENGKDVTPKPLVSLRPTILHDRLLHSSPAERLILPSDRHSTLSRTGYSISSMGDVTPEIVEGEDIAEKDAFDMPQRPTVVALPTEMLSRPFHIVTASITFPTSEQELEKSVTLTLVESDTMVLLDIKGNSISSAYDTLNKVLERNEQYKSLLQAKIGSANYSDSSAQTIPSLRKSKECQLSGVPRHSEACQANSWDISDTYGGRVQKAALSEDDDEADVQFDVKSVMELTAGFLENAANAPVAIQGRPNQAGSRRGSGVAMESFRHRGSVTGSIVAPSRRGSNVGSVGPGQKEPPSRRTSITGSQKGSISSRRGSMTGSHKGSLGNPEKALGIAVSKALSGGGSTSSTPRRVGSVVSNAMQRHREDEMSLEEFLSLTTYRPRFEVHTLKGLAKTLEIAERALVQNSFHDKLLFYRDFRPREQPLLEDVREADSNRFTVGENENKGNASAGVSIEDPDSQLDVRLEWLWDFQCEITEGRNVSCMGWNKVLTVPVLTTTCINFLLILRLSSTDLLTVGYGQFEFGTQKGGLIAFWSLKNPRYPHAVIYTSSDVTALDFSTNNPNLLAVGFYDGNVAVYDAKNYHDSEPVMATGVSSGKHSDPVWKLQWIDASSDHGESLVSISTDGRVTQWSLKKDLEYVNLMRLKRLQAHNKGAQPLPFISRHARGLCFDFSPRDPSMYLVGTEEGFIHKCSRSYNEQYLRTYLGHTGPVFQVQWSTFLPYMFLSCSNDWTVRLWREDQESCLLIFQTATVGIGDLRWSLQNSCVFGTVAQDGRLEIWDMARSAIRPTVVTTFENIQLSCLLFSEENPIVISAGSNGAASVFRLVGFDGVGNDMDEIQKLKEAIVSNVNTVLL